jgi:hypothetical protein
MSEKILNMTDPAARTRSGNDRIFHVPFAASQVFTRRGGKAVDLHHQYQAATANSSNLAGWLESDAVGVSGGHPETVSAGDKLPVNFGVDKTAVMPTTGRAATEADVGKSFDIAVVSNAQYVNMSASDKGICKIESVLDDGGEWVGVSIPLDKRYGNL